jgi:Fe(3+) dicitrate transport protein
MPHASTNATRQAARLLAAACLATPVAFGAGQDVQGPVPAAPEEIEMVTVVGVRDATEGLPGSHQTLDAGVLEDMHVMTTSEALRKVAGVNVRDEEGFGLRPNIGMRGLNPTRSTKTLLLEDGIPLAYAPYGDNASYYHPPIDRFARVEILKGAATNAYGPQTIGGVVNYITPEPSDALSGVGTITLGSRDYSNLHLRLGGAGVQLDLVDKRGDGARDNLDSELRDYNLKWALAIGDEQRLILRANHYTEDSRVTYSGLTDAELSNFGHRYNPFRNDAFEASRSGLSASHAWQFADDASLTTHAYYSEFDRDWWRQSSTTTDSQCNAVTYSDGTRILNFTQARAAGLRVDPDDCNSRQGRLRDYRTWGIEPRLRYGYDAGSFDGALELGVRMHRESQRRRQVNASSARGEDGTISERNQRGTDAVSAFVQHGFGIGALQVIPALRYEHIENERTNRLTGASGDVSQGQWLPSLGISWQASDDVVLFFGAHRGFAPPRTEDLLDNSGVVTDVSAEESLNLELGIRARFEDLLALDATVFRNDFDNQIAVGSIAGGSTPLAEGRVLYEGVELSAQVTPAAAMGWSVEPYARLAYTYLPTADIESNFRRVDTGAAIAGATDGNRLPYAPEHLVTLALGADLPGGFDAHLEYVFVGAQYADFANTRQAPATGNGQAGRLDSYGIWNAALNFESEAYPLTLFLAVKNIGDDDYIVDRTRGIQTAPPRLVQGGVKVRF